MIEAWVPVTLAGAALQAVRTGIQKHLKTSLSTDAINLVRYLYGFPLACLYLGGLLLVLAETLPAPNLVFLAGAAAAGLGQIVATSLLIALFSYRNFAVGTTYTKTEAVQTALFGLVFFGEDISLSAFGAILVCMAGVVVISISREAAGLGRALLGWTSPPALMGLASGGCFAFTGLFIRMASNSLEGGSSLINAGFTLAVTTGLQTLMLGGWILHRDRGQYALIARQWRLTALVGLLSVLGSIAWFTALTLQKAAYVRALGQSELVLSLLISWLVFREKTSATEIAGMATIVAGIVILVLWR